MTLVKVLSNTVAFGDTTAKALFEIPANGRPLRLIVDVTEAFNGTGDNTLNVGITGTLDKYASVDVGSVDHIVVVPSNIDEVSVETGIKGIFVDENSDADAGAATVILEYADEEVTATGQPEILFTIMDALAIRDDNAHLSGVQLIGGGYAGVRFFVSNTANKNVSVQAYGSNLADGSVRVTTADAVTVLAGDTAVIDAELWPYVLVSVTAAEAPGSGAVAVEVGPYL